MNSRTPIIPTPFQTLIKKSEPIAIPIKELNVCTGLVQKDENISRNRVFAEIIPHNPSQSIEAIAHVGRLATQKVAQVGA